MKDTRRGLPSRALAASFVTIALVASTKHAHAIGPVDIEAVAQVGYGTNPSNVGPVRGSYHDGTASVAGIANALHGGVGGRIGASFLGIYLGVSLKYYIGESGTLGTVGSGAGGNIYGTAHTLMFGGEIGYDLRPIPRLTIRPQLGIGNADHQLDVVSISFDKPNPTIAFDTNYVYLEPGVTGLVSFGHILVGADVTLFLLPTDPHGQVALTAHAQAGVRF